MASGLTNKLLLVLLVVLTCALFVSALNFAESNDMIEDLPTCKVIVKTETIVEGKCIRLRGGRSACSTESFLDPVNEDCT